MNGHTIRSAVFIASMAGLYLSAAMLIPAGLDFYFGNPDWQVFAISAFVVGSICLASAAANRGVMAPFSKRLGFLVVNLLWLTLSITGAIPFYLSSLGLDMADALFESVSAVTTTGATLYVPERLSGSLHLWRALVGWMGGFFVLLTAIAVLAPMNLGGFEVMSGSATGQGGPAGGQLGRSSDPRDRLVRYFGTLFPAYAGLTLVLWVALLIAGDRPLVAACHAMSTLSTSGISPVGGMAGTTSGGAGELLIFLFLVFALSRRLYPSGRTLRSGRGLLDDPELRMALLLVTLVPALLFLRHWVGALEVDEVKDTVAAAKALWGTVFTVLSFLTTTGFESVHWAEAQDWSGLATPGLILAGLAVIGGGVATTAGGREASARLCALPPRRTRDRASGAPKLGRRGGQGNPAIAS